MNKSETIYLFDTGYIVLPSPSEEIICIPTKRMNCLMLKYEELLNKEQRFPKEQARTLSRCDSYLQNLKTLLNSFRFIHASNSTRNRRCNNQLYDFLGILLIVGVEMINVSIKLKTFMLK